MKTIEEREGERKEIKERKEKEKWQERMRNNIDRKSEGVDETETQ